MEERPFLEKVAFGWGALEEDRSPSSGGQTVSEQSSGSASPWGCGCPSLSAGA